MTLNPAANTPGGGGRRGSCLYARRHGRGARRRDERLPTELCGRDLRQGTAPVMPRNGSPEPAWIPTASGTVYATKTATKKVDKVPIRHTAFRPSGRTAGRSAGTVTILMATLQRASRDRSQWFHQEPCTGIEHSYRNSYDSNCQMRLHSLPGLLRRTMDPNVATKICNVCHTYKAADPNKMVNTTSTTPFTDNHNSGTVWSQMSPSTAPTPPIMGEAVQGWRL